MYRRRLPSIEKSWQWCKVMVCLFLTKYHGPYYSENMQPLKCQPQVLPLATQWDHTISTIVYTHNYSFFQVKRVVDTCYIIIQLEYMYIISYPDWDVWFGGDGFARIYRDYLWRWIRHCCGDSWKHCVASSLVVQAGQAWLIYLSWVEPS